MTEVPALEQQQPQPTSSDEFRENRLFHCVRREQKEMRGRGDASNSKSPSSRKVDRWFLKNFYSKCAYAGFRDEFADMGGTQSAWESKAGPACAFIETIHGGNTTRQLSINASNVGPAYGVAYVACEGPTNKSVFDFWQLVWQENVKRIVSVNFPGEERLYPSTYDAAKETIQYWPTEPGQSKPFMPFQVKCLKTKIMNSNGQEVLDTSDMVYRVTRLRLTYSNPFLDGPAAFHDLVHVCYYRWPDGRLPIPWPSGSYASTALNMVEMVQKEIHDSDLSGKIAVHCHAGLGRTGVFIALDIALRELKEKNSVDVRGVVEKLRECRSRSVMNSWQFAYINLVVAERALQTGCLSQSVGGHNVRPMLDATWQTMLEEVSRQFNGQIVTFAPDIPRPK